MNGISVAIASASPMEETSNWLWMYSKKVLLVHRPARCISNADFLFKYNAIAPPALRECDPILEIRNPFFFGSLRAVTASLTARTIWELRTCCQGKATDSRNAQIRVSSVAFIRIMSIALATTALTGQQEGSPFRIAWCDNVSPFRPFF